MSPWGDTLTDQLTHDILMDQQHGAPLVLTGRTRSPTLTTEAVSIGADTSQAARAVGGSVTKRPRSNHHSVASAFDVVAVAASAGGLQALSGVFSLLPADFPAALVVVQHLDPRHRSLMADILSRRTALKVKQAEEGDELSPGT